MNRFLKSGFSPKPSEKTLDKFVHSSLYNYNAYNASGLISGIILVTNKYSIVYYFKENE